MKILVDLESVVKNASVPFFVRPITDRVADQITSTFLKPNYKTHYQFLESQLATSPDNGEYLCGKELTAADIMMSFPLEAGVSRSGMTEQEYPRLWKYVNLLHQRDAYQRSVQKIKEIEGIFKTSL